MTVAIMSYKYGHLIGHCIETVLSQTKKPEEIIAVDDGAYDWGAYIYKYPIKRIRREVNMGIVDNFNDVLFNHVKTKKIMFLGADNWLHPRAIELMDRKEDIVSCDMWIVGEGKYRRLTLPHQPHGSAVYNVKKARQVGGYEHSGGKNSEEDSMLFKKMFDSGASFYRVDKALLYYRTHKANFNKR